MTNSLTSDVIDALYDDLVIALKAPVANKYQRPACKIAQKVGEEAVEVVIEAVKNDTEKLAAESADLLYQLIALWVARGLDPNLVYLHLEERCQSVRMELAESHLRLAPQQAWVSSFYGIVDRP
jgi:phosphoribosyl-ATP pyrophosphohydrolase